MNKPVAENYDLLSIVLHWLIALLVFALFSSGLWMVDLNYYSPWYQVAPWWHKGIGSVVFFLVCFRFVYRKFLPRPRSLKSYKNWQRVLSKLVHFGMNALVVLLTLTGYLIVTAQGQPLNIFDLIYIPAVVETTLNLEDISGLFHYYLAYMLIVLALGHMIMALKHHFIDHDVSLLRMLGKVKSQSNKEERV